MNALLVMLVAAACFGAVTSVITWRLYPRMRRNLVRVPGEMRSRLLLGLLAAPLAIGLGLGFIALLPGLLGMAIPALDHCTKHHDDHLHLCLLHAPAAINYGLSWALMAAALLPVAVRGARSLSRIRRARRVLLGLERNTTSTDGRKPYVALPSNRVFAVTMGLWRPRIYVSTQLLRGLDRSAVRAMLAHEVAHVRGRDPLRKFVGELLSSLHLPATRQLLLQDLSLAFEEACDESAAGRLGSRIAVAEALVSLSRLMRHHAHQPLAAGAAFGDASLDARVRALLSAPKRLPTLPTRRSMMLMGACTVAVLAMPLHHLTETLFGHLLR